MPAANVAHFPARPARPTIEIDGARQSRLEAGLLEMEIADSVDAIGRAELSFGNWGGETPGFQYFDRRVLEFGKPLVVKIDGDALFEGRISAIVANFPDGGTPTVGVLAEDRLQDLRMTRRTRTFLQESLAGVARRIASDHGLTPRIDVQSGTVPVIAQVNHSDLALLLDLARREDAQVWVRGAELHVARVRPEDKVELRWAGPLREFHVEADLAHQRSGLVAAGWDVAAKSTAEHRAGESVVSGELDGLDGGATILGRAFAERIDTMAHGLARNSQEARAMAEAGYRQVASRFVTGSGVADTQAGLKVGAKLVLSGLGKLFDGDYRTTAVVHRFDPGEGLRSEFACERPGIGRP
jgi:uncharacterized protein